MALNPKLAIGFVLMLICSASNLSAQRLVDGFAWQVLRYDITVTIPAADRSIAAKAVLQVRNIGRSAGTSLTLRINKHAQIDSVKVGDANAVFAPSDDFGLELQKVRVSIPQTASGATLNVEVQYHLAVSENSGLAQISAVGSQFLPLASWYPTPGNQFLLRGPDTAPFRITVNSADGASALSEGRPVGPTAANSFEQTRDGMPFFVTGKWEAVEGANDARGIVAYLPAGASAAEKQQALALLALAASARSYFSSLLGTVDDLNLRLIAVERGSGFADGGTLLLERGAFTRGQIDARTALQIGESVARAWIGCSAPVRGDASGTIREGLTRYLATLFLEKQFGVEAADAERLRERTAYAAIAKRDAPLSQAVPLADSYYGSVVNKGAMFWRLVERELGRAPFFELLRARMLSGRESGDGLTFELMRTAIAEKAGPAFRPTLDFLLDKPTDLDLMIGLPQLRAGAWVCALRNLGSFDVQVSVAAVSVSGAKLTQKVTIPARNFAEVSFTSASPLRTVEVDPDKLYPQLDYGNDMIPRVKLGDAAIADAKSLFDRAEYAKAEAMLRSYIEVQPADDDARARLARTLLAENKLDQAEREFKLVLAAQLPSAVSIAWADYGLAEIAARKGQPVQAVELYGAAVRAEGEYAATLAARSGRIKAEQLAANGPPIDEAVKAFLAQFDRAVVAGRKADIDALVLPGELTKFAQGITYSTPRSWTTRVLRTEAIDAVRVAVDVQIDVGRKDKDETGTAVLILARVGAGLKLARVEYFEVR